MRILMQIYCENRNHDHYSYNGKNVNKTLSVDSAFSILYLIEPDIVYVSEGEPVGQKTSQLMEELLLQSPSLSQF